MNDETLTKLLIDHNRRNSSFFGCHSPSPPAEGWTICWLNKLFLHLLRQSCVADTHLQCGLVLEVASFIVRSWTILKVFVLDGLLTWGVKECQVKFGKSGATEGDWKLDTAHSNETFLSKTIPGGLGARNDGDERGSRRDMAPLPPPRRRRPWPYTVKTGRLKQPIS